MMIWLYLYTLLALSFVFQLVQTAPAPTNRVPRGIWDTLKNKTENLMDEASASVQEYTNQSLVPFFSQIPGPDEIKQKLNLTEQKLDELPLQVLNLPGYANWTSTGWSLRIRGQVTKQPLGLSSMNGTAANVTSAAVSLSAIDDATNMFLPQISLREMAPADQVEARNLTSAILSIFEPDVQLQFLLQESGPAASGWSQEIVWPNRTDERGEFNAFVHVDGDFPAGSKASQIVRLDVHTNGTDSGNATAYLVPDEGVTIVSDIDDVLRVTKIYEPEQGLLNTFARKFASWLNMPDIYSIWSKQHPERPYHFHYLTTTPEPGTRSYMDYIYTTYPLGSFDTRAYNFTTYAQTFTVRKYMLENILETFPKRKFVLIADTSNFDVMTDYPLMATMFPERVQCILLRNTSATDAGDHFPYNTAGFKDVPQDKFMFFDVPDDLAGLDFGNGDCVNKTVKERQGITYGWQNLPLGLGHANL